MNFDREYYRPREPRTLDDFTDGNVQAIVEGRRKHALPRPNVSATTSQLRSLEDLCTRLLAKHGESN